MGGAEPAGFGLGEFEVDFGAFADLANLESGLEVLGGLWGEINVGEDVSDAVLRLDVTQGVCASEGLEWDGADCVFCRQRPSIFCHERNAFILLFHLPNHSAEK
jgi:hypothetical protein